MKPWAEIVVMRPLAAARMVDVYFMLTEVWEMVMRYEILLGRKPRGGKERLKLVLKESGRQRREGTFGTRKKTGMKASRNGGNIETFQQPTRALDSTLYWHLVTNKNLGNLKFRV